MKNLLLIVVASSLVALSSGTAARAQVVDSIVADIPFAFTIRNTTMPPGEYTIKRAYALSEGVMEISSTSGHERMAFLVDTAYLNKGPNQTELIFDRVGDQYFLSEIFEAGDTTGVELPKSRTERKLEKEGAINQIHSVNVIVNAAMQ